MHLMEELEARDSFKTLPEEDRKHLAGDIQRAYKHIVLVWVSYMQHLKSNYPYLFSLAVRTNPFNPKASIVFNK
ncbi:hypothetical protein ACFLS1_07760 [Verrucomicrobiota bacterium]